MKAPWNSTAGVGTQTMMCSDCHNTDSIAPAAQGPHGSAYPFLLRVFSGGPAPGDWSTNTVFNNSWCANCHLSNITFDGDSHTGHHGVTRCYSCHIVIPHGGKVSRLIATRNAPARYAWSNNTNNFVLYGFTKGAGNGNYGSASSCGANCDNHNTSGGSQKW